MTTLRIVLGDQLTRGLSSLRDHASGDIVLMMEVADETAYVAHHRAKIAFILSAMRHHAQTLRDVIAVLGVSVNPARPDEPDRSIRPVVASAQPQSRRGFATGGNRCARPLRSSGCCAAAGGPSNRLKPDRHRLQTGVLATLVRSGASQKCVPKRSLGTRRTTR